MNVSVVFPTLISTEDQLLMSKQAIVLAKSKTSIDFEFVIVETDTKYLSNYADIYIHEKNITNATKSINRGFKNCSGDYVVLLTNDVFVDSNWLECLIDCFDKKEDCGLSTLASTQFNHTQEDIIDEGIWFSVAMIPKKYAFFDESYVDSWDDSDIIMNVYKDGLKMYRNYNCVVKHDPGKTQYSKPSHNDNFHKNRKYFMDKWKDKGDKRMYRVLTEGAYL